MTIEHLLPSAPKQFLRWAETQEDLAELHGGRAGTKLAGTLPALRVTRVGGSPADPWEDNPLLQVEAWGSTEAAADTLIRTLVGALPQFRGEFADGKVGAAAIESGPFWSPDDPKLSTNARYIVTIRLLTTP